MLEAAGWSEDGVKIKGNNKHQPFRHGKKKKKKTVFLLTTTHR